MNAIVQAVVNNSALDLTWIKITNATNDSFLMSIDSRVTGTGPISSTMAAMELDMAGPAGVFGRLKLPEIVTKAAGTQVQVTDQLIKITDLEAFKAFVKALMLDEELTLKLENGATTIKALFGMKSPIVYAKTIQLKGMNGLKTVMVKTEGDGKSFKNTLRTSNPSPVEIDLGTLKEGLVNAKGETIAEQKGKAYLMRGETEFVMEGSVTGVAPEGQTRRVGLGVEEDNWTNLVVTFTNAPTTLTPEFEALCKASI